MERLRAWGLVAAAAGLGCAADPPAFPSMFGSTGAPDDDGSAETTRVDDGDDGDDAPVTGGDASSDDGKPPEPSTSDDAASETMGPPPAACGDGVRQASESCDDANASEIDGCTSSCEIGPIGVAPTGDAWTSEQLTINNPGPSAFEFVDCPDGQAIVSVAGSDYEALGGLTIACATAALVDSDPAVIDVGPGVQQPALGFDGDDWPLDCGEDRFISEIGASAFENAFGGIGGSCRNAFVIGMGGAQSAALGPAEMLPPQGYVDPNEFTACDDGMVATGIEVYIGAQYDLVAAIALRCRTLTLVYPQ